MRSGPHWFEKRIYSMAVTMKIEWIVELTLPSASATVSSQINPRKRRPARDALP
jgi:hypothetical protein